MQYTGGKNLASVLFKYDMSDIGKGTQEKKIKLGFQKDQVLFGLNFEQKNLANWDDF